MVVAEACRIFGWTADYVLGMPATRFFSILSAGRRIRMAELADLCDIAAIPMCDVKYHKQLKGIFLSLSENPKTEKVSRTFSNPHVIDAGSDDAMYAFMSLKGLN